MTEQVDATPYPALNQVLSHLVQGAQEILKDNFVGAYLQGSFAIGDFGEYSDCDFVIVTNADLSADELARLQQLHQRIPKLDLPYWPLNIEGSYAPRAVLRRWSTEPRDPPGESRDDGWSDPGMDGMPARCYPFWYLPHGSDTLVRSEHDNSQVVRWTLYEKGVHLAGPDVRQLVDPVSADALRAEIRELMDSVLATGLSMPIFALQAFWVGLFCRILHSTVTGRVTSKKEAMSWAQANLDGDWQGLISRSLTLRKGDAEQALRPVESEEVETTRAFARYCRAQANALQRNDNR